MIRITGFLYREDRETFEEYLKKEPREESQAEHDSYVENDNLTFFA